jgi:hypothetical protein
VDVEGAVQRLAKATVRRLDPDGWEAHLSAVKERRTTRIQGELAKAETWPSAARSPRNRKPTTTKKEASIDG